MIEKSEDKLDKVEKEKSILNSIKEVPEVQLKNEKVEFRGRPKSKNLKKKIVTIRYSEDEYNKLLIVSKIENFDISFIIRTVSMDYVKYYLSKMNDK